MATIDYQGGLTPQELFNLRRIGGGTGSPASAAATPGLPISAVPTPSSLGDLGAMASTINQINRAGQIAALQNRIPGLPGLEEQSSRLISQEEAGQVPADVMRLLQQEGAEGATVSGGNPNAAYLRALGLTSLDLQQRGEANLTAAEGRNPAAPLFDPALELLTPGQAGNLAIQGGQLGLSAQEEAARELEAQQRLALEGGGGRGGAGRTPTVSASDLGLPTFNYGPATTSTGDIIAGDPYARWLASITPNAPRQPLSPEDEAYYFSAGTLPTEIPPALQEAQTPEETSGGA